MLLFIACVCAPDKKYFVGKKKQHNSFSSKTFLTPVCVLSLPSLCSGHISLCHLPLLLSSQQLHLFGFNQTCPGGSRGSHGGFDLFHRTAESWLGSPTLSSVCSSPLLSSTSSTASYYYPVLSLLYILLLSKLFIFLLTTFIPDFYYLKL